MQFSSPPPSELLESSEKLLPIIALLILFGLLRQMTPRRRRGSGQRSRQVVRTIESPRRYFFDGVAEAQRRSFSKKRIFNSSEQKVLNLLRDELANALHAFYVLGQVHLAEVIYTDDKYRVGGNYYVIGNKRLDFLVVDASANAVLAVEYHGAGHFGRNASKNDKIKSIVLEKAGVPLLVVTENQPDSAVRQGVRERLGYAIS